MLASAAKKLSYRTGLLGAYHRKRNRRTLTAVMFHRVMARTDPKWAGANAPYTLESGLFGECLDFFQRHYNVVSLEQVLDAREGRGRLPDRALLLTFDDGWADNAEHALPALQARGMPALMFVVADAVGKRLPFWQEQLQSAMQRGCSVPAPFRDWQGALDGLSTMDAHEREAWLDAHRALLDDGCRHMVDGADLVALQRGQVALGTHGKTHVRMQEAVDLDAELGGANTLLRQHLAEAGGTAPQPVMSFPHGSYDANISARARSQGNALAFTSEPGLNRVDPEPSWLLARTGFEPQDITDASGRLLPERLALYLFRRPVEYLG